MERSFRVLGVLGLFQGQSGGMVNMKLCIVMQN